MKNSVRHYNKKGRYKMEHNTQILRIPCWGLLYLLRNNFISFVTQKRNMIGGERNA